MRLRHIHSRPIVASLVLVCKVLTLSLTLAKHHNMSFYNFVDQILIQTEKNTSIMIKYRSVYLYRGGGAKSCFSNYIKFVESDLPTSCAVGSSEVYFIRIREDVTFITAGCSPIAAAFNSYV